MSYPSSSSSSNPPPIPPSHPQPPGSVSKAEVCFLVQHFLQEHGFIASAQAFSTEAHQYLSTIKPPSSAAEIKSLAAILEEYAELHEAKQLRELTVRKYTRNSPILRQTIESLFDVLESFQVATQSHRIPKKTMPNIIPFHHPSSSSSTPASFSTSTSRYNPPIISPPQHHYPHAMPYYSAAAPSPFPSLNSDSAGFDPHKFGWGALGTQLDSSQSSQFQPNNDISPFLGLMENNPEFPGLLADKINQFFNPITPPTPHAPSMSEIVSLPSPSSLPPPHPLSAPPLSPISLPLSGGSIAPAARVPAPAPSSSSASSAPAAGVAGVGSAGALWEPSTISNLAESLADQLLSEFGSNDSDFFLSLLESPGTKPSSRKRVRANNHNNNHNHNSSSYKSDGNNSSAPSTPLKSSGRRSTVPPQRKIITAVASSSSSSAPSDPQLWIADENSNSSQNSISFAADSAPSSQQQQQQGSDSSVGSTRRGPLDFLSTEKGKGPSRKEEEAEEGGEAAKKQKQTNSKHKQQQMEMIHGLDLDAFLNRIHEKKIN